MTATVARRARRAGRRIGRSKGGCVATRPRPTLSNGPRLDTAPSVIGSTQLEVTARKQSYVIHPALVRLGQVKHGLEQAESDACSLRGRGVAPAAAQVTHRS
jgi:hypothetical protein